MNQKRRPENTYTWKKGEGEKTALDTNGLFVPNAI